MRSVRICNPEKNLPRADFKALSPRPESKERVGARLLVRLCLLCLACLARHAEAQVESVEGAPSPATWVSNGRLEGHLAPNYSPEGAFSPDGSLLAVAGEGKIVLLNLAQSRPGKILKIQLQNVADLDIQSANFISPTRLFVMARGLLQAKGQKGLPRRTPELGFQWYIDQDQLFGKINAIGAGGGFGPLLYFPEYRVVGLYKNSNFDFWDPNSGRAMRVTVPDLTHQPNVYAVSPDLQWMLLAQIETSGSPDPVVVHLREHKFVDMLAGHQATVLSLKFSRDGRRVVTACEDGKVRVYSVGDWKLLHTLGGHQGPVHWAEFSRDGKSIASAGEDKTVRVWSTDDGKLLQVLSESQSPLLTTAFSPTGEFLTASAEHIVLVWKRTFGSR